MVDFTPAIQYCRETMFLFNLGGVSGDIVFDIETYPNVFTFRAVHAETNQRWNFEISDWRNDLEPICRFMEMCQHRGIRWVGYNNIGFDYPVMHFIYENRHRFIGVSDIYNRAMEIINAHGPRRFAYTVWERDQIVKQVDLYKIHHFDNMAKATSLKVLEFNMNLQNVEDLPFPVGIELNRQQADVLTEYNDHDIFATKKFLGHSLDAIEMRRQLSEQFRMDLTNCSDVKIGEKILVHELEKAGVACHHWVDGRKQKKQTVRESINLSQVIFPYVQFERQEFDRIHKFLAAKVITETKGTFADLVATVDGCEYKFGTGGLHMSVDSQIVRSDETHQIVDVDVASYYPNLAIKNRVFPAHLGPEFCDTMEKIFHMRKQYDKKDPRNGALKLAMNGAYGLSNNEYSPFLDAFYTMSITINGQLLLCMLVEQLIKVPGLRMIQANTDGVTYLCPREYLEHTRNLCRWWESLTMLELEEALYSRMFIRDVNSYIAEKEDGSLKRIGAYAYETALENPATRELPWHKDWSARVTQMAAEAYLVKGTSIPDFISDRLTEGHVFDFLLRTKVPRSSTLEWGGETVSNIVRYYISRSGRQLEKVMPPAGPLGAFKRKNGLSDQFYNEVVHELALSADLIQHGWEYARANIPWDERIHTKNQSTYQERRTGINTGWDVKICNDLNDFDFADVNLQWYIKEAEKLVTLLGG